MRRKTTAKILNLATICLGLSPALLRAQPVPVQQFDENQQKRQLQDSMTIDTGTNAPELYPAENDDVGPQHILRMKPRATLFEAIADTQYGYTDNNRLLHNSRPTTAYDINTLQLAFAPNAMDMGSGSLSPRAGFRTQWYNFGLDGSHGGEDALDFNAQTFFTSMQYVCDHNWVFDAELDYTRLLTQQNYSQFYAEIVPMVGVSRVIPLCNQASLTLGWQGDYHFTRTPSVLGLTENANDRLDNTLSAALTMQVAEKLFVQPYFSFEETHYTRTQFDDDRNDYFQTVGVTVSYYFARQFAVRVSATESFRESDDPNTTSYEKFDTGLGAMLDFRF